MPSRRTVVNPMKLKSILFAGFLLSVAGAFLMGFQLVEASMTLWRLRDVEGVARLYWSLANGFNILTAVFELFLLMLAWLFYRGYRD